MTVSVDTTETQVLTVLRSFLLSILPTGTEVIRGYINRVAMPQTGDFVVMMPTLRTRLATNTDSYSDGYLLVPPTDIGSKLAQMPVEIMVQLDVHGNSASDNVDIIQTLFRDDVCCEAFAASGIDISPLYTSDPRFLAFGDGEDQEELRWSIDVAIQFNPIVTVSQDFASKVNIGLVEVDATYPPH